MSVASRNVEGAAETYLPATGSGPTPQPTR